MSPWLSKVVSKTKQLPSPRGKKKYQNCTILPGFPWVARECPGHRLTGKRTISALRCSSNRPLHTRDSFFLGTQHYCPPEFYSHHSFYGTSATIWQLGFLLNEMLTGEMPYVKPRMALYMKPSISKHISEGKIRKYSFRQLTKDGPAKYLTND